uniref:Integrase zinc-binding domain-containing protein n=1 Tax=Phytophthora ramorum TaxID=164328 RepID=H3GFV1_PHYRM
MAHWLSFFAEYNFEVKYKPGRQNGLADALSRRPDYELSHVTTVTSSVTDLIRAVYARDDMCVALLRALGSKEFGDSDYPEDTPRIVVPHDEDLKYRILYEAHDTALSGHLGREKTYGSHGTKGVKKMSSTTKKKRVNTLSGEIKARRELLRAQNPVGYAPAADGFVNNI